MIEEWRDIEGYEGKYQVSSLGRVKSLNYNNTMEEKILKQGKCDGYLKVVLCKNNKIKRFFVHRLVACAFIDNKDNKPQIDHINAIKDDNRAGNLRWVTNKENSNNPISISKHYGANNYKARKVLQFTKEGLFIREWGCTMDIKRDLGFSQSNISSCCLGKLKTSHGFIWQYA